MNKREINDEGIALIKRFEGLKLEAYRCSGNIWTIGYGHTGTARPDMKITEKQAWLLLHEDLRYFESQVSRLVKVPLTSNQFSALVCFVFNVGDANFARSTLLELLNRGWYEQVPVQLKRWNRVSGQVLSGLVRRREAEAQLWNKPDEATT